MVHNMNTLFIKIIYNGGRVGGGEGLLESCMVDYVEWINHVSGVCCLTITGGGAVG